MDKGIFNIYKPIGVTSHDVVDRIRRLTGEQRVGHAGTLDPLADGVLVIAVGREFTKTLDTELGKDKEYQADIMLGQTSTTDDEEGEKRPVIFQTMPTASDVQKILPQFIGQIEQVPPIYSAIHIDGKRAYKIARAGKSLDLKPRSVLIKNMTLASYEWPYAVLDVICGSGVYIRSLARDIGVALGCGGYIHKLRRTRVGEHRIENAQCPYHDLKKDCEHKK